MTSEIEIRPARPEDADAFLELVDALADYEKLARPSPAARQRLLADGFGDEPRFRAYLAAVGGRIVAYAITFHTYSSFLALPTFYLEDIFVLPDARRSGVGRRMFEYLANQAVRDGCGRMEWVVLDWNRMAIDFYEKLGANRLGDWHAYRLDRDQMDALAGGTG